jgi:pimeloyl-ACP methyl ester carboxylesterase
MPESQVRLFGSTVHYWTCGREDGRTILMVHGFRGNHIALMTIAEGLGDLRVVALDLPGFGASTAMTDIRHDVAGYCTLVKAFMGALRLERPVLLGESFGSVIASRIAASEPELIDELVLLNPIAVRARAVNRPVSALEDAYYWLCGNLPGPLAGRLTESTTVNRIESLALLTARDRETRRHVYRHRLRNLGFPQDRRVIAEAFPDSMGQTAADGAERIPHRTLLVAGEKDALSPAKYQRLLRDRLARGTLVLIPDTGHFAPLETPDDVARARSVQFLG